MFNISYVCKKQSCYEYQCQSKSYISDPAKFLSFLLWLLIREKVKNHSCPAGISTPPSSKDKGSEYLCNCIMYGCSLKYSCKEIIPEAFYLHIFLTDKSKINQHIQSYKQLYQMSGIFILFY